MKVTHWFFLVVALVSLPAVGDVTYFSGRDVVADFENFMGTSGNFNRVWIGNTKEGKACQFSITKSGNTLSISPTTTTVGAVEYGYENDFLARQKDFIVGGENNDIRGGFEANELWASYFIDEKTSSGFKNPHGQFGISFSLKIEKNEAGRLIRLAYTKTDIQDLGYRRLGSLECFLKQ